MKVCIVGGGHIGTALLCYIKNTHPEYNVTMYTRKPNMFSKHIKCNDWEGEISYMVSPDAISNDASVSAKDADVTSPESDSDLRKTITDGEQHFRLALQDTLCPVVETGYPNSVYLDAETSVEMGNLATVLREYARTESAKFITGARPLSELNDYFDQLEALGAVDYVKVYQDYYDAMQ